MHVPLRQSQDGRREQNRAWQGHLLHARCQMRRLAHRRVIHMQIIANDAHHHLPGIEADAHLQRHTVAALHLGGVLLHRRLHG